MLTPLHTPTSDTTHRASLSRRRSKTESANTASLDGLDIDATTPSRRRKQQDRRSPIQSNRSRSRTESSSTSFFPRLTRVLETGESSVIGKPGRRVVHQPGQGRDRDAPRARRLKEGGSATKRSAVKVGSTHRRSNTLPLLNPSLLSVLSSLTRASDGSSSSNTTITQQSFDRMSKNNRGEGVLGRKGSGASDKEQMNVTTIGAPSVFDYMETTVDDALDKRSIRSSSSSSSSHYQPSDSGSSELPDTPSSASTFASSRITRKGSATGSVAELRRKYDAQYASSVDSQRSGSRSPELDRSPPRSSVKKLPQLRDVAEDDEHDSEEEEEGEEGEEEDKEEQEASRLRFDRLVHDTRQSSTSHSHSAPVPPQQQQQQQGHDERLQAQKDALMQHVAQEQQSHAHRRVDSAFGQHRSHSSSSNRSMDTQRAWAQYMHDMQVQQYSYPSPNHTSTAYPASYYSPHGQVAHSAPPQVPDAPNNMQRTVVGYELLARELSSPDSPVQPLYRRFEYLHHRILLHMQDELQEMEEQLRRVDEIIATMEPPPEEGQPPTPSSRRGDKNFGTPWHHQRTELLGRIFLKTKDYNAAIASFASMTKHSATAEQNHIEHYRDWLTQKSPIHELETRFLATENEKDLISPILDSAPPLPPQPIQQQQQQAPLTPVLQPIRKHPPPPHPTPPPPQNLAAIISLSFLPILLFSMIPTFAGRFFVTLLMITGTGFVAAKTRFGDVMPLGEWVVCAAVYVLVSMGIAGCVPVYD